MSSVSASMYALLNNASFCWIVTKFSNGTEFGGALNFAVHQKISGAYGSGLPVAGVDETAVIKLTLSLLGGDFPV